MTSSASPTAAVSCISLCPEKTPSLCKQTLGKTIVTFLVRGNALDLAMGLVLGLAFSKIVVSIINDLLLPAILCGVGDFSLQDRFFLCRKRKFKTLQEMEQAGFVTNGQYKTVEDAVAAGLPSYWKPNSLEQAQTWGLNTLNYGRFLGTFVEFIILVLILAFFAFAIQKIRCSFDSKLKQ